MPSLGVRIQLRRKELGLTLAQLAATTELSAGYLSQVENDQAEPSLSALRRVAQALGISLFWLLYEGGEDKNIVVRAAERLRLKLGDSPIEYELMTPGLAGRVQLFQAELLPGAASGLEPLTHAGAETLLVQEGEVELQVGGRRYLLGPGDAATYEATIGHRFANTGAGTARILLIQLPPRTPG